MARLGEANIGGRLVPAWLMDGNASAIDFFESTDYPGCIYRKLADGTIEWVNPPMLSGKEYRTVERYLGKPVYVKVVDFGALPNTATKYVDPNISNFEKLIGPMTVTIASSDSSVHDSPLLADTKILARAWFKMTSGGIAIRTMEDCTSNSAVVKLKYTKTTD